MTAPHKRADGGKTYYWDGTNYASAEAAAMARAAYERDGFETCTAEHEGITFVYTRRVVSQAPNAAMN